MINSIKPTIIRCDDVLVDCDYKQFKKICQIIERHGFDHLIGITPLGEGKKLWREDHALWKLHFMSKYGFFINYRLKRMAGEKPLGENKRLVKVLNSQFSEYNAIPALHGLHHYKYTSIPRKKVYEELSKGVTLLKKLFDVDTKIFTAPFNAWNKNVEIVCNQLNLSIDRCTTGFDKLIKNMNSLQIKQLAKNQSSVTEVNYHPYRIVSLKKFELYLKTRRKYI